MTEEINGTLLDAYIIPTANGFVVSGRIYGDTKRRFVDGQRVRTSLVVAHSEGVIRTRNSVYKVDQVLEGLFARFEV